MGLPFVHSDSNSVEPRHRFDQWRQGMGSLFSASLPDGLRAEDFEYRIDVWRLGKLLLNDVSFGAREQRRSARSIRSDQVDHYRLLLQTQGELRLDADGAQRRVGAGQIVLSDLAREELYESDGGSNIVLFIPRETLDELLPRPFDLHGAMLQGAIARILADHLRALVSTGSALETDAVSGMVDATLRLIAAGISAGGVPAAGEARAAIEATLLRQVCRYVDLHLRDENLGAETIAAAFKMSRATLYRLLEPFGGVATYIRECRLERAHEQLAGAQRRVYVERIADEYGFKTTSNFSRAFREHFGYTPSEAQQRRVEAPVATLPATVANRERAGFQAWLQAMRD